MELHLLRKLLPIANVKKKILRIVYFEQFYSQISYDIIFWVHLHQ